MDPYVFRMEELPLSQPDVHDCVTSFLASQGLRLDSPLQKYFGVFRDDRLVGGAGYDRNVIKCAAVESQFRGEGIAEALVSRIVTELHTLGRENLFIFTKPANEDLFASLGFARVEATPDVLLLETGLGGRLDATNVLSHPAACVITPIGRDHADFLGNDLKTIAFEKAGIFKKGAPAVIAAQDYQIADTALVNPLAGPAILRLMEILMYKAIITTRKFTINKISCTLLAFSLFAISSVFTVSLICFAISKLVLIVAL